MAAHRKPERWKPCEVCGTPFTRPRAGCPEVRWQKARYCGRACQAKGMVMPRPVCACGCGQEVRQPHSKWRPGHHVEPTVIFQRVVMRDKVRWVVPARGGRSIYWSRIVMWNEIGREPLPSEVVHHINGDSEDDRPENLRLYSSNSEHMRAEYLAGRLTGFAAQQQPGREEPVKDGAMPPNVVGP